MKKIFIALTVLLLLLLATTIGISSWFLNNVKLQTEIANSFLEKTNGYVESVQINTDTIKVKGFKIKLPQGTFSAEEFVFSYSISNLISKKLTGNGTLKNAKIVLENNPQITQEKIKQQEKITNGNEKSNSLKLPIDIDISSFDANLEIVKDKQSIFSNIKLTSLKLTKNDIEFELNTSLIAIGEKYTIFAKKLGKVVNAKVLANTSEIFIATAELEPDFSGKATAKLNITPTSIAPIEKVLKLDLPKTNSEIYTNVIFNVAQKHFAINSILKCNVDELNKSKFTKEMPFNSCEFSSTINASIKSDNINIAKLECDFSADNVPVANLKCATPIEANLQNIKTKDWINIGVLTLSIPSKFIDKKIDGDFSADNISAILNISANKTPSLKISTPKPANIENAKFVKNAETLVEKLTLFFDINAFVDLKTKNFNADTKIQSVKIDEKQLTIVAKANKNNNRIFIDLSTQGYLNALLYSINSISSNLKNNFFVNAQINAEVGELLEITKLNTAISCEDAPELVLNSPEKIIYNLHSKKFENVCTLKFKAKDFPFAPLRPFSQGVDANTISLEANARLENSNIKVDSNFEISDFSYSKNAQTLIDDINAKIQSSIEFEIENKKVKASLQKIELSNSATTFCTANANVDVCTSPIKINLVKSNINLLLPPILSIPALSKFNNIERGKVDSIVEMTSLEDIKISAKISNFASKEYSEQIESIVANVIAKLGSQIKIDAQTDIISCRGTTSAKATIEKSKDISASIEAKSIIIDDLLIVKSAFVNPLYVEQPLPEGKKKIRIPDELKTSSSLQALKLKDKKAFWSINSSANLSLKINQLLFNNTTPLKDFIAEVKLDNNKIELSKLSADILNGKLSGNLKINFDEKLELPYCIEPSTLVVDNFDVSRLSTDEFLKGIFNVKVTLSGTGTNIEHLKKYVIGSAKFEGKNGSIRLIRENSDIGKKISLAQTTAKLVNAFVKSKDVDYSLKLVEKFSKVNFNSAKFELSRNSTDYNINFNSAEIVSTELIIKSLKGTIYFDAIKSITEQDMDIELAIYSKNDEILKMLKSVNALSTTSDIDGFSKSENFKIYGTIAKPQTNLLEVLTTNTAAQVPTKILKKLKIF